MNPKPSTPALLAIVRTLMDSFVGALLGGLVYGAWAVWANGATPQAWWIGGSHALMSIFLTYTGTGWMAWIHRKTPQPWLVSGAGLAYTYAVLVGIHTVLGTPQLWLTLALGLLPNLVFCSTYSAVLTRTSMGNPL